MYDAIRARETDVSTIASNNGIKPQNIQKVKDHVFYNEHLLDRYVQSDLKKMATQLELERLEVRQPSNTVIFNGLDDFKSTKKGGMRWPN